MGISKLKAIWALLTGGITGILKYLLTAFNRQVLGKITNKETGLKYLKDAQAVYAFVRAILDNHKNDLTEEKKKRGEAVLAAIEELTKALEDFEVDVDELNAIIAKVNEAIDAFKKAD